MPRAQYLQTNFTSGEISPKMRGRVDVNRYVNGAKAIQNFVIQPQGGITRRPGTLHVAAVKDSTKATIIREFIFSASQSYILEIGDEYLRFHQNGGRLENPTGNPLELVAPWDSTDLDKLKFAQSADILYVVHPDYPPYKLSRFGASTVNANITNCADNGSGFIRVTATGHGLTDGQNVVIANVTGTTEANGAWTVTYVDANNVDLQGSAFSNAYVSGGFIGLVNWSLEEADFTNGPFQEENTTDIELSVDPDMDPSTSSYQDTATMDVGTNKISISNCADNGGGLIRVTATAHGFTTGDLVFIEDVLGTTEANGDWTVTVIDVNNIDLQGSTFTNAYVSGGTVQLGLFVVGDIGKLVPYRDGRNEKWYAAVIIAFTDSAHVTVDVFDDNWIKHPPDGVRFFAQATSAVQSSLSGVFTEYDGGKMIRHFDNIAPWLWGRLVPDSWAVKSATANNPNQYDLESPPPYTELAYTYPTISLRISDRLIVTDVTSYGGDVFVSSDVGRAISLIYGEVEVTGKITAYVSATQVTVELNLDVPPDNNIGTNGRYNNGRTKRWALGAWSETTGYPSAVTFHEQRLAFANTLDQPQTVWMSKVSDYENFAANQPDLTVLDDNAITYTIASNDVNPIYWLNSGPVLLLGTLSAEWQVKASSINEPLTPSNVVVTSQTPNGSVDNISPIRAESATLFITRSGQKLREMTFSFELDAFTAKDLTIISEHMLRRGGKCIDMAFQREPHGIIWCALEDGKLVAMTYQKEHEVVAWHYHPLGGTSVEVESIAVVPTEDGKADALYLVVKRVINSVTVRHIEYLDVFFDPETTTIYTTAYHVDNGIKYSGVATSVLTGLDHLEGETVSVMTENGELTGPFVVSSGQITLGAPGYAEILVGLNYESIATTLPPNAGSRDGTAQGKYQRVNEVTALVVKSYGLEHRGEDNFSWLYQLHDNATTFDFFSGDIRFKLDDSYKSGDGFSIRAKGLLPLTVVGLSYKVTTND